MKKKFVALLISAAMVSGSLALPVYAAEEKTAIVTTGTQKFQFNRLMEAVDKAIETGTIAEEVFAQTGASDYKSVHYKYRPFLASEEM